MLAYGDDTFSITLASFLSGFEASLSANDGLERARLNLVFAGQLQQAAEDGQLGCAEACRHLTAVAATVFVRAWEGKGPNSDTVRLYDALQSLRTAAERELPAEIHLRTPEGFAWYALYPDAYAQAARTWLQRRHTRRVLVVGIRSIGTALASVVATVLRGRGVEVETCTVRPFGHPFHRRTDLAAMPSFRAEHAIVVDEGPGLSGSSMASVAEALIARGIKTQAISFFPAHPHGPGARSSPAVRQWWDRVEQVTSAWGSLRVGNQGAAERLRLRAGEMFNESAPDDLVDLGCGKWRAHASNAQAVLGLAPSLERPKYLARSRSGRGVLFKFAGFSLAGAARDGRLLSGVEHDLARLHALAEDGFTVAPFGKVDGWVMLPWATGRTLSKRDTSGRMLHRMAAYIIRVSAAPLCGRQADEALMRLRSILCENGKALLGQSFAARAEHLADSVARELQHWETRSYGDGRLAPHEWIETEDCLLKLDAAGHSRDHTAIGRQSILWDVAGAAVDWELSHEVACELARAVCGPRVSTLAISYYCAAYAAFRAGLADTCLRTSHGALDKGDLSIARATYARRLRLELDCMDRFASKRIYMDVSPMQATKFAG